MQYNVVRTAPGKSLGYQKVLPTALNNIDRNISQKLYQAWLKFKSQGVQIGDIEIQSIAKIISATEIAETTEETRLCMTDIKTLIAHERV